MTSPVNGTTTSGLSFADPSVAQRARDAIRAVAGNVVDAKGTNPNVGRVMSVDIARLTASVFFPGDDAPVQVGLFPGSIPLDLGDYRSVSTYETSAVGAGGLVYVENFRGRPYITRILSGGEYQLNANVAGLTHRTFNANPRGTISGPPINDIYERHVNVKVNAGSTFTVGKGLLIGPWAGQNDGSSVDGIVELVLTYWVTSQQKNQVKKYQFSVSDRMVTELGNGGNTPYWMRILPETNLGTNPHAQLEVDIALLKTGIRAPLELWFRLMPMDTWADQSVYFMSVKTYGSAFNVGDPTTGRLVTIQQDTPDPVQGWLGFHRAGMSFAERDTYNAGFGLGTYFDGDEWSTGPWRSGPLRAAKDLLPLWTATSQWLFGTDFKLFWEGNIVFSGIGPNWNALHSGSISVPYPSNHMVVLPSDPDTFATQWRSSSGGILFNPGDTLYYGLSPGVGTGGQNNWEDLRNRFFIVDSKTYNATQYNFQLPEWAIPIAQRAYTANTERQEIIITSPTVQADLDDKNAYTTTYYASSHTGIVGSDQTETMGTASFRFKAKTAYKVEIKTGIQGNSGAGNFVVGAAFRKGTTVAGTYWGEFLRGVVGNTTTVCIYHTHIYVINDTNADIVTPTVITMTSTQANTATWNRYGSANIPSYVKITKVGPATKWIGMGMSIT